MNNLYRYGTIKYGFLNILAILSIDDIEKYSCIMNNIISSNDGEFSMKQKYSIKKNRCPGCFSEVADARYRIEPRLVGTEKILYPFRSSTIELDLTTRKKFSAFFRSPL